MTAAALVPALLAPAASSSAETVTSLADSGPGTLRAAIANTPAGGTVDFEPGLDGTIELADVLEISKDLRIDGPEAHDVEVSGMGATRAFHVYGAGTAVVIDDLTIRRGLTPAGEPWGGGVLVTGGDLIRLVRVAVLDNEARGDVAPLGGGIAVGSSRLELVESTVADNRASTGGGGVVVRLSATFDVVNSTIAGNSAPIGGGLLALDDASGAVRASTLTGNTAELRGPAIGAAPTAGVTVAHSLISGNRPAGLPACDGPVVSGGENVVDSICFTDPDGESPPRLDPAVPAVPVLPPQAQAASASARLLGSSTRARTTGQFTVRLRCEAVGAPRCAGSLALKLGARRLSHPFSIAAGGEAVVRLRLSPGDRRRLAKRRSLRSAVTLVTTQPDGSRRTTDQRPFVLLRARRR
jgi:hypothetical protein